MIDPGDVRTRLESVHDEIRAVGRDPSSIEIVAVTKGHGVDAVQAAAAAGLSTVGENYAQELLAKHERLEEDGAMPGGLEWDFIGRIQRNKVSKLAGLVRCWHGVDRLSVGEAIARRAPGAAVYVQVNLSGAPEQGGCDPEDAPSLVAGIEDEGLEVRGLMVVATHGDADRAGRDFSRLASLGRSVGVRGLSMGMSSDYLDAVRAGATVLRLGTVLFGPRPHGTTTNLRD